MAEEKLAPGLSVSKVHIFDNSDAQITAITFTKIVFFAITNSHEEGGGGILCGITAILRILLYSSYYRERHILWYSHNKVHKFFVFLIFWPLVLGFRDFGDHGYTVSVWITYDTAS